MGLLFAAQQYADPKTGKRSWRLTALDPWTLSRASDIAQLRAGATERR